MIYFNKADSYILSFYYWIYEYISFGNLNFEYVILMLIDNII